MELFDSYQPMDSTVPFTMFAQYGDDGTLIKLEDEGSDSTPLNDSVDQIGEQFGDEVSLVEQSSPSEGSPMMEQAAGEVAGMYQPLPVQQEQPQEQEQQSYVPQQAAHQVFFPMNEAMRRNLQQQQQQQQQQQRVARTLTTPVSPAQMPQQQQQQQQFAVKRECPVSSDVVAQQPKPKRSCTGALSLSSSRVSTPVVSPIADSSAVSTTLNSCVQELVKGKSEDVERFRNTLRCQGSLTPELEKQLKRVARQVKNRESAQLSRQRKREYVETLKDVIGRMSGAESALRTQLESAQAELVHSKTEAERWQAYAHQLQQLALEHGLAIPREPEIPQIMVPHDTRSSSAQALIPEHLFDGPCGFGRRTTIKSASSSSSASAGASARHNSRSSK